MNKKGISFLSCLTTGPQPDEDEILEIAFVRVEDEREVGCEVFTANPEVIPAVVKTETGLDNGRVAGEDGPRRTAVRALAALGDGPVVVHDSEVFKLFIDALHLHPPELLIDVRELAAIVMPQCADYSLASIAKQLDISTPEICGGAAPARLTRKVWEGLAAEISGLPAPATVALSELVSMAGTLPTEVFEEAANRKLGFELSVGGEPQLDSAIKDWSKVLRRAGQREPAKPRAERLDTKKISAMFQKNGAIGRHLADFEPRDEQIRMTEEVCEAFNRGMHLMCEAGTGTGKSLAYLLPAIAWARRNDDKVIISTNTKNLQEQLYGKDLPFLEKLVGGRFKAALLKGRGNYLCVRKFLYLMQHKNRELSTPAEAAALMPIVSWACRTKTGDISECTGLMQHKCAYALQALVSAAGEECRGKGCDLSSKCFVRLARALAGAADVIVVNHALVFSDAVLERPHLPPARCIVLDEAHNIEDAATGAATTVSDTLVFYRICRRLWRERRDGSGSGLISSLMGVIGRHLPQTRSLSRDTTLESARGAVDAVGGLKEAVRDFFDMLSDPFESLPAGEDRVVLEECRPAVNKDGCIGAGAELVAGSGRKLRRSIEILCECLLKNKGSLGGAADFVPDLENQKNRIDEALNDLEFILDRGGENYVYWLERSRGAGRNYYRLKAAPLDVGDFMRSHFFDKMRTMILTSATLRVENNFEYMKERLGASKLTEEKLLCMTFGSPFDFRSQTRLCVPAFLPDAGGRRDMSYDEELSSFLIDLLRGTTGRSLVLFTSYSLLDTVYERLKRPLERMDIPLLAQGRDGSRKVLTELFKKNVGSVLLGTQSFWEGVDVLGESLSCLVITKLPFHVFTDPLVQGRIRYLRERNVDPFRHYTLPEAVINFRQGFGRLIRHRNDCGAVVVTDRRLVTRSYGRSFLSDIPVPHKVYKRRELLISDVKRFLQKNELSTAELH